MLPEESVPQMHVSKSSEGMFFVDNVWPVEEIIRWRDARGEMRESKRDCVVHMRVRTFPIVINHDLPVEQLLRKNKFELNTKELESMDFDLSVTRTGQITTTAVLIDFINSSLHSDLIISCMEKVKLRPAKFHELLWFGSKYPRQHKDRMVVALGSVTAGINRLVASLSKIEGEGSPFLPGNYEIMWYHGDLDSFLAFPKEGTRYPY